MVLRSTIVGLSALLFSQGAMPLAHAAPPAANAPETEPQSAPAAESGPRAFVPETSAVRSSEGVDVAVVPTAAPEVAKPVNAPQFGGAFRARWITLPSWFLGMFTKANRALSSYGVGVEGFRRKRDAENANRYWDISLGLGYQKMSPPDGNWLGKGKSPALDTDWVQFKNFGFWTIDFSYIGRQYFNDVFGVHYGAGLGLAIVQGDVLRTSSEGCTSGNLSKCRPNVCEPGKPCPESALKETEKNGNSDSPSTPHRFKEGAIPGAIPLINLVTGIDFRIPTVPGLEIRAEGGFYNAFFLGGSLAYFH